GAARNGTILVRRPSTIEVLGGVNVGNKVFFGPDPGATPVISPRDVHLFVNGTTVHFAGHADVRAGLCAPAAQLRLTRDAHVVGMFGAGRIRSEVITGESPPTTVTTTTLHTTTTTTGSSTTTTTSQPVTTTTIPGDCAALCGNGRIDAECGEKCDGNDFGT